MKKCFPFNTEPCSMKESFPELPNRFPPYMLCNFNQRNTMNDKIDGRREAFVRDSHNIPCGDNLGYQISPSALWNIKQAPKETFNPFTVEEVLTPDCVNLGGRGDVFYGYARNIDVESELFKINYLNDKCFDDKFKVNPNKPDTSLYKYREIVNNHSNIESNNPLLDMYVKAQENTYRNTKPLLCVNNPQNPPQPKQSFVPSIDKLDQIYFEVGPGFTQPDCWPKHQDPWNNLTKRKAIYHRNNYQANYSRM